MSSLKITRPDAGEGTFQDKFASCSVWMSRTYHFFYQELMSKLHIHKSERVPTMGVNFTTSGMNLYYNEEFVNSLPRKEFNFIIIHELDHLLFKHLQRQKFQNHEVTNWIHDMIINSCIYTDVMKRVNELYKDEIAIPTSNMIQKGKVMEILPNDERRNIGLFVPKEYEGELISEDLYDWLMRMADKYARNDNTTADGLPAINTISTEYGVNGINGEECQSLKDILEALNNNESIPEIDYHMGDDVSPDFRDQIIQESIDGARMRGTLTGDTESILQKLRPAKKNPIKSIMKTLSNMVGNKKTPSWMKPSRKNPFSKGNKKYKTELVAVLDTSGSMTGSFEKVLANIFYNEITINLIMDDTEIKSVIKVKNKKELQKLKIKGGGGTCLQPALDYIKGNKVLNSMPVLVMTDGYTDTLNFDGIKKKAMVITCGEECPITGGKQVKQYKVEPSKNNS